jgi:uncharacterized repeat protein (TIGR01451 family)
LAGTTTFSIRCTNPQGGSTQANATVYVVDNPPPQNPTASLWAEYPNGTRVTQVSKGTAVYLHWTSDNATECHPLAGAGFETGGATSGYDQVSPLAGTTTFSIRCTNPQGGSTQANATVYVVDNPPPPPQNPTVHISANPSYVSVGSPSVISWYSTNANECHATAGPGFSTGGATSGSDISSPIYSDTTFSVTCSNAYGFASDSVVVYVYDVNPPLPPPAGRPVAQTNSATGILQSSATLNGSVNPNGDLTSYWFEYGTSPSLGNTTSAQLAGSGNSYVNVSASISGLNPNTTYYFRVVAQNSHGTSNGSILSFTTASSGGGGGNGSVPTVQTGGTSGVTSNSATVSGTVNPNGLSTIYWFEYGTSPSLGNSTAFQSAGSGNSASIYTANLSNLLSNKTYYYRIVAQNSAGVSYGSILSFTTVPDGSGGGNNCSAPPVVTTFGASNIYQNSAQLNGSVNPNNCPTTYWFEYGLSYWLGNSTAYQSVGASSGQFNILASITGLAYNTTYYFRAVAQNAAGTTYGSILSFQTTGQGGGGCVYGNCSLPSVQTNSASVYGNSITFYGQVNPNGSDTYAWFVYGPSPSNLYYSTNQQYIGNGTYYQNYSQTAYNLSSGTTYYYQAVARNNNGTSYGQILSTSVGGSYGTGGAPSAITNPATYVYSSSALLNGQINPNGAVTNGWFEYGLTTNLGSKTDIQPMGAGNSYANISFALSGLLPNTTYYYRVVAQNNNGTSYGSILSFTTGSRGAIFAPTNTSPSFPTTVVVTSGSESAGSGGVSCVVLIPSLNVSELVAGEQFTYTVTYKNGCAYNLSNVYMKIILPPGTQFVSTNYPFFNRDANGISYNLGSLPADFQSAISIQGVVDASVKAGNSLIFSSVLNFNDLKGRFQSISAYLTAVVGRGKTLTASAIDAFGALLGNWLFDLILLLVVILLIYWIFFKKPKQQNNHEEDVLEAKPLSQS